MRRLAAAGVGAVAAAHALPAASALGPLRRRAWPALSGLGHPSHVALTFDDGPDPASTPLFLDVLAGHGVRATFFVLADMLARAPQLGCEIVAAGHEMAVHGWDHRNLLLRGPRATGDGLARARDLIAETTGAAPRWFRPPYGILSSSALLASHKLGMRPVLWTSWGRDWTARATPRTVFATVVRDLRGGGTVLLHDSDCTCAPRAWAAALGALPQLLEHCAARGLAVGPLHEHWATPS